MSQEEVPEPQGLIICFDVSDLCELIATGVNVRGSGSQKIQVVLQKPEDSIPDEAHCNSEFGNGACCRCWRCRNRIMAIFERFMFPEKRS